jgi:hypothetical protein
MFKNAEIYRQKFIELNNEENLPPTFLRRNYPAYPLISYIQISFSFLMSESYDKCVFYIYRAKNEKESLYKNLDSFKQKEFTDKGMELLLKLQEELIGQGLISESMINIIIEKK